VLGRSATMSKAFLLAAALLAYAKPSHALQPLEEFLNGAFKGGNADVLEAQATLAQTDAQKDLAWARVLPGFTARGTYTRNQYDSVVDLGPTPGAPAGSPDLVVTIVPLYQWDGAATLTVPLVDLAGFWRIKSGKFASASAQHQLVNTRLLVESTVAQDYYQLVANMALVTSAQRALDVSRESLRLATVRRDAGVGPELDVDRARADVESQTQQVAAAQLQVALSARALTSASGVTPDERSAAAFVDALQDAPPLDAFENRLEGLPSVDAAKENRRSFEEAATAQRLALLPTLGGSVTERGTSAPGFTGHDFTWQAVLALSWQIDFSNRANIHLQDALTDQARAREIRARLAAADLIHRQWSTIAAGIVRSRSARAGQEAASHAVQQAHDRYEAGTITQLDLLTAQRDAFVADVTRIQADADLVNARAQLRLAAGSSLLEASNGGPPAPTR
jgi:outer membrane protein TolC